MQKSCWRIHLMQHVQHYMPHSSESMGKMFQAEQLTQIFDHRSLLQNISLISAKLNFHEPLVCFPNKFTTHSFSTIFGHSGHSHRPNVYERIKNDVIV